MVLRCFKLAHPKLSILSLVMLLAVLSIWLHTNEGKKIEWNGIDPQASHPTYAIHLQWDDWSFLRLDPLSPAAPASESLFVGKHRHLCMGLFWQWQWPRVLVMTRTPRLMYYCTGFETELRLPYWFLFTLTSIFPVCYILDRLRRRRENAPAPS